MACVLVGRNVHWISPAVQAGGFLHWNVVKICSPRAHKARGFFMVAGCPEFDKGFPEFLENRGGLAVKVLSKYLQNMLCGCGTVFLWHSHAAIEKGWCPSGGGRGTLSNPCQPFRKTPFHIIEVSIGEWFSNDIQLLRSFQS